MGENLDIEGRVAVRSPMQWSRSKNGGFSDAAPSRLSRPVTQGPFGAEHVNVADSRQDPDSLLQHVRKLTHRYRACPELGWGDYEVLDQEHDAVLAHRADWAGRTTLLLHNLSPDALAVHVKLDDVEEDHEFVDVLNGGEWSVGPGGAMTVELDGFGYRWLKHRDQAEGTIL